MSSFKSRNFFPKSFSNRLTFGVTSVARSNVYACNSCQLPNLLTVVLARGSWILRQLRGEMLCACIGSSIGNFSLLRLRGTSGVDVSRSALILTPDGAHFLLPVL